MGWKVREKYHNTVFLIFLFKPIWFQIKEKKKKLLKNVIKLRDLIELKVPLAFIEHILRLSF